MVFALIALMATLVTHKPYDRHSLRQNGKIEISCFGRIKQFCFEKVVLKSDFKLKGLVGG
jgi:hypothetical protein